MKSFLITTLLFIQSLTYSQALECECPQIYERLVQSLESNYIGLAFIKKQGKADTYFRWKSQYAGKANQTTLENCTALLQDFLRNFEDGHLFVMESPAYGPEELELFKTRVRQRSMDPDTLKLNTMDPKGLVGTWSDGISKIGIVKRGESYNAYIMESTNDSTIAGELKASFQREGELYMGTYYSYGHAPRYVEGQLFKEQLLFVLTGGIYWGKLNSEPSLETRAMDKNNLRLPSLLTLNNNTTLFSIPSFLVDSNDFIKVLTEHLDLIRNTKILIIDVRGNIGGNALYLAFLDAYATESMQSSQGWVLASADTKAYFNRLAKNAEELYGPVVERIDNAMGQIVEGPEYPERKFQPFESKIEQVAILMDHGSMSASESFILHSKDASDKVTTFGGPSGGTIDYTGINMVPLTSCERNIYFGYPTGTLDKEVPNKGYNTTGILPDVPIPSNIQNKIKFVMDYYADQKNMESGNPNRQ